MRTLPNAALSRCLTKSAISPTVSTWSTKNETSTPKACLIAFSSVNTSTDSTGISPRMSVNSVIELGCTRNSPARCTRINDTTSARVGLELTSHAHYRTANTLATPAQPITSAPTARTSFQRWANGNRQSPTRTANRMSSNEEDVLATSSENSTPAADALSRSESSDTCGARDIASGLSAPVRTGRNNLGIHIFGVSACTRPNRSAQRSQDSTSAATHGRHANNIVRVARAQRMTLKQTTDSMDTAAGLCCRESAWAGHALVNPPLNWMEQQTSAGRSGDRPSPRTEQARCRE